MIEAAEGVLETCGWCRKAIPEDTPVYACGIKVKDPGALAGRVGQFLPVMMLEAERSLLAIVPAEGSDVRKAVQESDEERGPSTSRPNAGLAQRRLTARCSGLGCRRLVS
jgi:hypothetical protein